MPDSPPPDLTLAGTGWLTEWDSVSKLLEGADCAWVDLSGTHLGPCPTDPPATTHLWAWRDDELFRVRIDAGQAIVARLSPGSTSDPDDPKDQVNTDPFDRFESVPVSRQPAQTWGEPHVRVGDLAGKHWQVVQVLAGNSMTFLRPEAG